MRVIVAVFVAAALAFVGASMAGPVGDPHLLRTRTVQVSGEVPAGAGLQGLVAWCALGETVTGGGYTVYSIGGDHNAHQSRPTRDAQTGRWGWAVSVADPSGAGGVEFDVVAVCAPGSGTEG